MTSTEWLRRLAKLNVAPDLRDGRGRAPNQPLLLLAVLDLVEAGLLTDSWVILSPDLVVRMQNLWPVVQPRRGAMGPVKMPFHALGSERNQVWSVFDQDGRPSRSQETSVRAQLPEDLLALLADDVFRQQLRRLLVTTYFLPAEQIALFAALGFEGSADSPEIAAVAEDQAAYKLARETGRSARFKNEVVSGYRFTCALTGYRLTTTEEAGIVEAAHIHQHAKSRNNDPDNGLALSPTAHALFDMGLWSVADDLRVIVKNEAVFKEEFPAGGFSLRAFAGRSLVLMSIKKLRPHPDHLRWHRTHHGFI